MKKNVKKKHNLVLNVGQIYGSHRGYTNGSVRNCWIVALWHPETQSDGWMLPSISSLRVSFYFVPLKNQQQQLTFKSWPREETHFCDLLRADFCDLHFGDQVLSLWRSWSTARSTCWIDGVPPIYLAVVVFKMFKMIGLQSPNFFKRG